MANRKIIITTESNCDIPRNEQERLGIFTVSTYIMIDSRSYLDWREITASDFFELTKDRDIRPTTSAVPAHDYETLFRQFENQDADILHIAVSQNFSACFNNAVVAAQSFTNVRVFDAKNVSVGLALAIYRAVDLRDRGFAVQDIISDLSAYVDRIRFNCVLDTVDFVRRGGRLPATVALGIELLKIKPEILLRDGKIAIGRKYRGKLNKALSLFVDNQLKDVSHIEKTRIFVANTLTDPGLLASLRDAVAGYLPDSEIVVVEAGPVISCHAGPNAFGLAFVED